MKQCNLRTTAGRQLRRRRSQEVAAGPSATLPAWPPSHLLRNSLGQVLDRAGRQALTLITQRWFSLHLTVAQVRRGSAGKMEGSLAGEVGRPRTTGGGTTSRAAPRPWHRTSILTVVSGRVVLAIFSPAESETERGAAAGGFRSGTSSELNTQNGRPRSLIRTGRSEVCRSAGVQAPGEPTGSEPWPSTGGRCGCARARQSRRTGREECRNQIQKTRQEAQCALTRQRYYGSWGTCSLLTTQTPLSTPPTSRTW